VYIAKSNGKLRGLGIPTMKDRAMQALYLLALDPIAEGGFCISPRKGAFRESAAHLVSQNLSDATRRAF